jgi:hypothetical protein
VTQDRDRQYRLLGPDKHTGRVDVGGGPVLLEVRLVAGRPARGGAARHEAQGVCVAVRLRQTAPAALPAERSSR